MPESISAVGEGNEKKIVYLCTRDGREVFNGRRLMDKQQQNVAYFQTFCIGQYKNEKGLTGEEAMKELNRYGVFDYLSDHFEILHTQSRQWLLADIDEFINTRKMRRQ